jgi:regulator of sigma E protease
MEFLTSSAGNILSALPPFLLVLTIVVFFHELGHYLVGRWCGIKAEVFSVGFGAELIGRTDRHGTRWKLSLIPLGGYVKFLGDENAASQPTGSGVSGLSEAERAASFPMPHPCGVALPPLQQDRWPISFSPLQFSP